MSNIENLDVMLGDFPGNSCERQKADSEIEVFLECTEIQVILEKNLDRFQTPMLV